MFGIRIGLLVKCQATIEGIKEAMEINKADGEPTDAQEAALELLED